MAFGSSAQSLIVEEDQGFSDMVRHRLGGNAQLFSDFRVTKAFNAMEQQGFAGARIGDRQDPLNTLEQLVRFGFSLGRTTRIYAVDFLEGLVGEDSLGKDGTTRAFYMQVLHNLQEKCKWVANRRFLPLFKSPESEVSLLNELVYVLPARSSALKQAPPQKGKLIFESIAQVLCPFSYPPNASYSDEHDDPNRIALLTDGAHQAPNSRHNHTMILRKS